MSKERSEASRQTGWTPGEMVVISEMGIALPIPFGTIDGIKYTIIEFVRGDEVLFMGNEPSALVSDDLYLDHQELILDHLAEAVREQKKRFESLPVKVQNSIRSAAKTSGISESFVSPFAAYLNQKILRERFDQAMVEWGIDRPYLLKLPS